MAFFQEFAADVRPSLAEALGTFALVFAGTGAIVINDVSGGMITHPGIAMTFGLIVMAMIYTFGDISGAHFNPAVTLAFLAVRKITSGTAVAYIAAQLVGAFLASLTMISIFPQHPTLGSTLPKGTQGQSFVLELILTLLLMLVILSVVVGDKRRFLAGMTIGGVVGLEAMFAGPICGASMNPARSIAPAVVSGQTQSLWIYIFAPVIGAIAATQMGKFIFPDLRVNRAS